MPTPVGTLRVHQDGPAITFQVEGRATLYHSQPLRRLAEQARAGGATSVRVDLRRCTYMDSTFLGTLLYVLRHCGHPESARFALVCPSPQCQRLLRDMGMDGLYPAETAEELPAAVWTDVCCETGDVGTFRRAVVQAHQELADLPGPAGEMFREVAQGLAGEPEAQPPRGTPPPAPR
jgi:anti-anti-sigma factor